MRTRRHVLLAGFIILGLVGGVALWLLAPPHRISRASFDAIEIGSTLADVQALVGVPPGDYTSEGASATGLIGGWPDVGIPLHELVGHLHERDGRRRVWCGDYGVIDIHLDASGRVESKQFHEVIRGRRPWLDRLLTWLGFET